MDAIDRVQDMSLHQRILTEIEGRILSGEWPPGYRIPYEHELTVTYGCSRMTVNKALTELVKKGLIERRRKAGSYVSYPHIQSAVMEIHDLRREVQALGLPYSYRITSLRKRKMREDDRAFLDLPLGASILDVTCIHHAGDHPFCLEERLINLAAVPEAAEESFDRAPPGTWLLGQVPWSAAEHRIRAVAADRAAADALGITAGEACLIVERRTRSNAMQVTRARLTYPGDRHELVAQFAPTGSP